MRFDDDYNIFSVHYGATFHMLVTRDKHAHWMIRRLEEQANAMGHVVTCIGTNPASPTAALWTFHWLLLSASHC